MAKQKPLATNHKRNLTMRIEDDLLERIDERRRHELDIPSRTELIRRMIVAELDRWEATKEKR